MKGKTVALIVAGGSGTRCDAKIPKQYMHISGKPMLRITIERIMAVSGVDCVVVAISPRHLALYESTVQGMVLASPIHGGITRQQTVFNALETLSEEGFDKILVHDACRPFVTTPDIAQVLTALTKYNAVTLVAPITESVCYAKDGFVSSMVTREHLYRVQTPQGFWFKDLHTMHKKYQGLTFTDDAGLFIKANLPVKAICAIDYNHKITSLDDIRVAQALNEGEKYEKRI